MTGQSNPDSAGPGIVHRKINSQMLGILFLVMLDFACEIRSQVRKQKGAWQGTRFRKCPAFKCEDSQMHSVLSFFYPSLETIMINPEP